MKQQKLDLQNPYLIAGFLKQGEEMGLKREDLVRLLKAGACEGGSCQGIASSQGMVSSSFNRPMTPMRQAPPQQQNFRPSSLGENAQMQQKLKQMNAVPKPEEQGPAMTQAGREVMTSAGRLIYPHGGGDPYFVKGFQPANQAGANMVSTVKRPPAPYIPLNGAPATGAPQQATQQIASQTANQRPAQPPTNPTSAGSGAYTKLRGWLPPQMEKHLDSVGWGTPQAAQMINGYLQKNPQMQKTSEENYLNYARQELFKLAEANNVDAKEYILEVTSSAETFEKAAALEAHRSFQGFLDSMQEHGASLDFMQGFMKEAQDNGFKPIDLTKPMTNTMDENSGFGINSGAPPPRTAPLGSQLGAPVSLNDPAPKPSATQSKQPAPENKQPAADNNEPIPNTMPRFDDPPATKESRHEIIPGFNNKWIGGLGGMLLGHFIGNEMGIDGPMGMLLPLLGAGAGYHYLPKLMNKWKDPAGTGANAIHPAAINVNRQYGYNM